MVAAAKPTPVCRRFLRKASGRIVLETVTAELQQYESREVLHINPPFKTKRFLCGLFNYLLVLISTSARTSQAPNKLAYAWVYIRLAIVVSQLHMLHTCAYIQLVLRSEWPFFLLPDDFLLQRCADFLYGHSLP